MITYGLVIDVVTDLNPGSAVVVIELDLTGVGSKLGGGISSSTNSNP